MQMVIVLSFEFSFDRNFMSYTFFFFFFMKKISLLVITQLCPPCNHIIVAASFKKKGKKNKNTVAVSNLHESGYMYGYLTRLNGLQYGKPQKTIWI